MIDQSFSPQNIGAVFDAENKRGTNIERLFEASFKSSLDLAGEMKDLRNQIKYETDASTRRGLIDVLNEQEQLRKDELNYIFEVISDNIKSYKPTIGIKSIKSMRCYTLDSTVESYFYSKILQRNLRETYKIKQQSRYHILKSVIHLVADKFPKIVVRTDIKKFYESIPQKQLLAKLDSDHLITINTKRGISSILESFNTIIPSSKCVGLPRGIGISAYLSEIYMRSIDSEVNKLEDLVYYARYVDDIIAIFTPSNGKKAEAKNYILKIEEIVHEKSNKHLQLNLKKTQVYDLQFNLDPIIANIDDLCSPSLIQTTNYKKSINYLGYNIGFTKQIRIVEGKTKTNFINLVDISDKKVLDYKTKIKLVFDHFNRKKHHSPKRAIKLLKARLEYLLTNTRLSNNKSNVFVGLHYSYPFISTDIQLNKLDKSLLYYISRTGLSTSEKNDLKEFSFKEFYKKKELIKHSFSNRKYYTYNANKNDVKNKGNNGVLKFGIKEITSIWK
ncbi:antiviral reverse transcriptase Drt3a [Sphingobacterium pedocola]|uniref:Reverse transcriptase domain-containing protein n=1 Tax=Sphingobacterium pedocola TaxID=2082722 RepID=A0ABR9TBI4_9SPHI|nr:antiviral reverse transcriptase Drt3a [Sphingobacterium pedocola]MBE8722701.1 hypothetical protein [Sphingobacterium pedocola]